ncbi:hypothetical protein M0D69_16825 [Caballeronia sp. SEWSISQ10-4 2]|uniref:hypothetical protein n=1 Tax=Caballeronia sp. SEWSISQ10-4 2 TaxID=2937438 RepID=UPI0026502F88|nr:hypothetical protein [Caballeronia sp. SEWSISQ10-4 2]MDN7179621.1 hypothetical protein [Caballeronia sp. SEWSISQ10-4 2]
MSDFLRHLASRSLGLTPVVRPYLSPMFAAPAFDMNVMAGADDSDSIPVGQEAVDGAEVSQSPHNDVRPLSEVAPAMPRATASPDPVLPYPIEVWPRAALHADANVATPSSVGRECDIEIAREPAVVQRATETSGDASRSSPPPRHGEPIVSAPRDLPANPQPHHSVRRPGQRPTQPLASMRVPHQPPEQLKRDVFGHLSLAVDAASKSTDPIKQHAQDGSKASGQNQTAEDPAPATPARLAMPPRRAVLAKRDRHDGPDNRETPDARQLRDTRRQPVGAPARADPELTIHVSIGRVEIRATPAAAHPARPAEREERQPSRLETYLRRRADGSGT